MDSHASPMHEIQTEVVCRQLSNEDGKLQQKAWAFTDAELHCDHHGKVVSMTPHSILALTNEEAVPKRGNQTGVARCGKAACR